MSDLKHNTIAASAPATPEEPGEMALRAYLADEITAAQETEATEVAGRDAERERERQRKMAAAIEDFRALVEPLVRPTIRDALHWRYEPYQDADEVWQAAACIAFNGQYLRLQRAYTPNGFRMRLIHPMSETSQTVAEFWTPARLEHELLLSLGELDTHLRELAELAVLAASEDEQRQRDAWAEVSAREWDR